MNILSAFFSFHVVGTDSPHSETLLKRRGAFPVIFIPALALPVLTALKIEMPGALTVPQICSSR